MEVLPAGGGRRFATGGRPVAMRREDSIALYLRELRGRLGGSWLRRRRIVSEVRAHLLEAAAAEPLAVRDPAEAARSAIARFGSVEQTVQAFAVETEGMTAPARARVLVAGASAVLLCAAALSAVLVHALGAHSVRTPRANGSGNQPARQVERLPRQILANVGAARLLARAAASRLPATGCSSRESWARATSAACGCATRACGSTSARSSGAHRPCGSCSLAAA